MISNKELQFISSYARQTPYPGDDYAYMVLGNLRKAIELFQKQYLDRSHNLIFSNGEEIEFKILTKNLAHMLGIDTKGINSEYMCDIKHNVLGFSLADYTSAYDILMRIIDRAEDIIKNDRNPNNKKILNYYKVMIKCAIFSKLSDFSKFNFGCINFDKDTFLQNWPGEFNPRSTKFLFTSSDEALIPYFMMGILYDEIDKIYIPETLFAPLDFQNFFIGQELLLPIQILTDDSKTLTKLEASSEDKLNLLNMYKFIINSYKTNSFINIFNDYETSLKEDMFKERTLVK